MPDCKGVRIPFSCLQVIINIFKHNTLSLFPNSTWGKLDASLIQMTYLLFCKNHTPKHLSMFQGRLLDLSNALLEDIVDVRVHVNILEGSNGLYHQNQQLFQVEDTLLQIQLQDCQPGVQPVYTVSKPTSRGLLARVYHVYKVSDCWPGVQPVNTVSDATYRWCGLFIRFQNLPNWDWWS